MADLQARLPRELNNVEGLTRLLVVRAAQILAEKHGILSVF